jgi:hypothetical protein
MGLGLLLSWLVTTLIWACGVKGGNPVLVDQPSPPDNGGGTTQKLTIQIGGETQRGTWSQFSVRTKALQLVADAPAGVEAEVHTFQLNSVKEIDVLSSGQGGRHLLTTQDVPKKRYVELRLLLDEENSIVAIHSETGEKTIAVPQQSGVGGTWLGLHAVIEDGVVVDESAVSLTWMLKLDSQLKSLDDPEVAAAYPDAVGDFVWAGTDTVRDDANTGNLLMRGADFPGNLTWLDRCARFPLEVMTATDACVGQRRPIVAGENLLFPRLPPGTYAVYYVDSEGTPHQVGNSTEVTVGSDASVTVDSPQ